MSVTMVAEASSSAGAQAPRKPFVRPGEAQGWALAAPPFLYAAVLLVAPIAVTVAHSFWTQDYLTIDRAFTLANYRAALSEPIYRDLALRSLFVALSVGLATVLLAYPVAYFISFHGGARKNLWLFLITVPFWTSYLLRVLAWKVILGYGGVLNSALVGLGLLDKPSTALLYNTGAVIVTLIHAWAVFAILPIFVSLERIDRTLLEAATDLGDGPFRRFRRVTLPLSVPGVTAALLIVTIPTAGDFVTPALVGGKDGVMIANAIQAQFGRAMNWPLGAALSVFTMATVTLLAGALVLGIRVLARSAR